MKVIGDVIDILWKDKDPTSGYSVTIKRDEFVAEPFGYIAICYYRGAPLTGRGKTIPSALKHLSSKLARKLTNKKKP